MEGKQALSERYHFRSTREIIQACEEGRLPDNVMFNFHPQRWTDSPALWAQELVIQNMKNVAKRMLRRIHPTNRSGEHTSELLSRGELVCRLLRKIKKHILCTFIESSA